MHTQAVGRSVFGGVCHGIANKERREPVWLFTGQALFCRSRQPQTSQAIAVVGSDQPPCFERLDDLISVCVCTRQTPDLDRWVLAGEGNQCQ